MSTLQQKLVWINNHTKNTIIFQVAQKCSLLIIIFLHSKIRFWHVSEHAVVHQLRLILTFLEHFDLIPWLTQSSYVFRSQLTYILTIYLIFKTSITMTNNMHKCIIDRPSDHNDEVFLTFCFFTFVVLFFFCLFIPTFSIFLFLIFFVVLLMILSRLLRFEKKMKWNEMYLKKKYTVFVFLSVLLLNKNIMKKTKKKKAITNE